MNVAEIIREKGVRPSYVRVRILDYMLTERNHPTADMIYRSLAPEIPTLSKTSVYNTVDLFLEKGLVQLIGIDEKEMRYDADTSAHAHFRCDQCGVIIDLPLNPSAHPVDCPSGLKVNEIQYYLKGLCEKCGQV